MNTFVTNSHMSMNAQLAQEGRRRRWIVAAGVVIFAIRDWSLWVLLRASPWGPPMRLALGTESVADAVDRTLEAVLIWRAEATLLQLKAGWQEQQVYVWGSAEQGAAVSLIHSVLLHANRDELRPNLYRQPVPSLHVDWRSVSKIETGQHVLDAEVHPVLETALNTLRSQVQRDPEIVLRYLADMSSMGAASNGDEWWRQDPSTRMSRETQPLPVVKEPAHGDVLLTLAEAALLYKAVFLPDEQIDLSNLRRRFLATNRLEPLVEERPEHGGELTWRRVTKAYRSTGAY